MINQGEDGNELYVIEEGRLECFKDGEMVKVPFSLAGRPSRCDSLVATGVYAGAEGVLQGSLLGHMIVKSIKWMSRLLGVLKPQLKAQRSVEAGF